LDWWIWGLSVIRLDEYFGSSSIAGYVGISIDLAMIANNEQVPIRSATSFDVSRLHWGTAAGTFCSLTEGHKGKWGNQCSSNHYNEHPRKKFDA
jgi:hypothetical protein